MSGGPITAVETGQVQILIPIYDDWDALRLLLPRVAQALAANDMKAEILVVDDGSSTTNPAALEHLVDAQTITRIRVLTLRRNMGHQRAIAVGLGYIEANLKPDVVVVMDGDGEDAPEDVPRLIECVRREGGRKAVFARRQKRAESLGFRIFYQLYRLAHRVLVGRGVQVGNFSAIPSGQLTRLVAVTELWNHYAAAFMKARLPYHALDTRRQKRLDGKSKMNLVSLVTHGLSAISVYSETVGTRLLAAAGVGAVIAVLGIVAVIGVRLGTDLAIPGWATYSMAFLSVLLIQAIMAGFLFTFVVLANRSHMTSAPCHDYQKYVLTIHTIDEIVPERKVATV